MTTDAARKAVFNTPELLENIIAFLPYTDILTKVKRLSRQWKDVVDSSPAIKTKLWMMSPNATAVQPTSFTSEHTLPWSPQWGKLEMPIYSHAVEINPMLLKGQVGSLKITQNDYLSLFWLANTNGDTVHPKVVCFVSHKERGVPDCSALDPRSSWRGMYLTHPPITTALIHADNYDDLEEEYGPTEIGMVVRDHRGLTFGLVYDTIVAGLPSNVRESLKTARHRFLGSLYITLQ